MNNPNHPQKGSSIKVEPIRQKAAIERIKGVLLHHNKYRDHAIFTLGINTAYRANELLSITVEQAHQILTEGVGCRFELKQSKNRKHRAVTINRAAYEALDLYYNHDDMIRYNAKHHPTTALFHSSRSEVLTVPSLTRLVKTWCNGAGLKGNYGSHTMRKTWGYWHYKRGTPLPILMVAFGHASQQQTLEYLCIQAQDVNDAYSMVL